MKVSREQFEENRKRILGAASRLFREKGVDGVGLDAIMKAAGLTHGGFYGHFKSKEDLVACACAEALRAAEEAWRASPDNTPRDPAGALARAYLTPEHCEGRGEGCALAALGADAARQGGEVRRTFTEALRSRVAELECLLGPAAGSKKARREQAITAWAGMVGAMVLARAVDDAAFSEEILKAMASSIGAKSKAPAGRRRRARRVRVPA